VKLGSSYVISARLVGAEDGQEFAIFRRTAPNAEELVPALGQLSHDIRGKVGESLANIRDAEPLERVTTSSLDALRKYAEGVRASDIERNVPRAVTLLKEAIALDSSFAMAWRKLATAYNIGGFGQEQVDSASFRAYQFRDRLPEVERLNVIGLYYGWGAGRDRAKATEAFEALSAISPTGYHNLAVQYASRRQFARAETLYRKQMAGRPIQQSYTQLIGALVFQGKRAEAESLARAMPDVFPGSAGLERYLIPFLYVGGNTDSVRALLRSVRSSGDPQIRAGGAYQQASLELTWGRLRAAERAAIDGSAIEAARGAPFSPLDDSLGAIWIDAWHRQEHDRAARRLDAVLARIPIRSRPMLQRPYLFAARLYALAGQPEKARGLLAQHDREVTDTALKRDRIPELQATQAEIALAERRPLEALALFRKSDTLPDGPAGGCAACVQAPIGRAFDAAGMPDSAIVAYESFLTLPGYLLLPEMHPTYLAHSYRRLGELYEQKGEVAKAVDYYRKFVELWKDADPELQPRVAEVRRRITRLTDLERR
jgi:tetratricopeptide (TPR) repeat protein